MNTPSSCPTEEQLECVAGGATAGTDLIAHLSACQACREYLAEVQQNDEYLRELKPFLPPPDKGRTSVRALAQPTLVMPGYEVLREMHRGGQGVVFKAVQTSTRRVVALKMLLRGAFATHKQLQRFEREIELVATLRHPNIVTLYDSGVTPDGQPYFVMEFIDGVRLDTWISDFRFPISDSPTTASRAPYSSGPGAQIANRKSEICNVLRLFAKICGAVNYAHQRGVVHRDLKPANILVDAAGEPHVLDFGLAKLTEDAGDEAFTVAAGASQTMTGDFMGTAPYAAPEQARGQSDQIDVRTDVYALGLILYRLLTGQLPYPITGPIGDVLRHITDTEPKPASAVRREIDHELDTILLKALAKERERRYQSTAALLADIEHYLAGEAIDAKRDSTWYVLRKSAHRHRAALAAGAVIAVLFVALTVKSIVAARRALADATRLKRSLSVSNIERAHHIALLGSAAQAEPLLWQEFLYPPPVETDFGGDLEASLHANAERRLAFWALWEHYSRQPCLATESFPERRSYLPALSANLSRIAANENGWIKIWQMPERRLIQTLDAGGEAASGLFSPDGSDILVPNKLGAAVWDVSSGERRFVCQGRSVALILPRYQPPDATGAEASTAGEPVEGSAQHQEASAANGYLAVINDGGVLRVCDPSAGQCGELAVYQPLRRGILMASTRDGRRLAAQNWEDTAIDIWDVATGQRVQTLRAEEPCSTLALGRVTSQTGDDAPTTDLLAGGWGTGYVGLWDAESGRLLAKAQGHGGNLYRIYFSPDGSRLASSSTDNTIVIWGRDLKPLLSAPLSTTDLDINYVAPTPAEGLPIFDQRIFSRRQAGRWVCVSSGLHALKLWDIADKRGFLKLTGHSGSVFSVVFRPGTGSNRAPILASGSYDKSIKFWDVSGGVCTRTIGGYTGGVSTVAFSPAGDQLASCHSDGRISIRSLDSEGRESGWTELHGHQKPVASIGFSPDGKLLASGSDDDEQRIRIWDVAAAKCVLPIDVPAGDIRSVRFSPKLVTTGGMDYVLLAAGIRAGTLELYRLQSAPVRIVRHDSIPAHVGPTRCVRFSPDGRLLATAGDDRTVNLWSIPDLPAPDSPLVPRGSAKLDGHGVAIFALAFSPDNRLLASGDKSGTIKLWDAVTHNCLVTFESDEGMIFDLCFSPDGKTLAYGHNEHGPNRGCHVGLWDLTYFDRHIAGNLDYWIDRSSATDGGPADAASLRAWADQVLARPWPRAPWCGPSGAPLRE